MDSLYETKFAGDALLFYGYILEIKLLGQVLNTKKVMSCGLIQVVHL